jgi:prepilin-type N-terminal cleavage/methylation domain-containing protein
MARSRFGAGHSEGFTLLEILVALTILAFAFGAVLRSLQSGAEQERIADTAMLRLLEARSRLDAAVAAPDFAEGIRTGAMPDGETWRLEVTPLTGSGREGSFAPRAFLVVLTMSDRAGELLTLRTIGLGP